MLTYTPQGRCTGSMLHCNTALLFSMHPAEHGMAAGLTAITQLSVRLCVSHCGLWVQKGTLSRCRVRTSPVTGLSPSQRGTATCPVASTTWLLASLILFKGLKPPGGPTVRSSQTNNLFSSFLFKDVFNLQTAVTGCPKWEVIFKKSYFFVSGNSPFTLCSQQDFTSELFHMEVWFVPLWGDELPAQTGSSYEKGGNGAL